MIRVVVLEDSEGCVRGVELKGHAGYGEEGEDIVCAAVSALVLNAANSVEAFTEDDFFGEAAEEGGDFSFHFTGSISPESQLLMKSLVLGLQKIRDEYGEPYINIRLKEV